MIKRKALTLLSIVLLVVGMSMYVFADTDVEDVTCLIDEYVNAVNNGQYENIAQLFTGGAAKDLEKFLGNEINAINHTGIFNVIHMSIESTCVVDNISEYGNELTLEDYDTYDDVVVYYVDMNVIAYEDTAFYSNGLNEMLFVTGKVNNEYKILQTIILSHDTDETKDNIVSTLDYDTPVVKTSGTWSTPGTINVYMTDTGETKKNLSFFHYCQVVTVCEVEEYAQQPEAIKAVALAVKNYAWKRIITPKYSDNEKGCHVYSNTNDQVYNEDKYNNDDTLSRNVCNTAVQNIWSYVMLDYEYGLFVGFHCDKYTTSSYMSSYAKYHGGVLSQSGAKDLAAQGYSWQEILHYYYDYGTCGWTQLANGPIRIVNLNHSATASGYSYDDFYHWKSCTICGGTHLEEHDWETLTSELDRCTICGYVIKSILVR